MDLGACRAQLTLDTPRAYRPCHRLRVSHYRLAPCPHCEVGRPVSCGVRKRLGRSSSKHKALPLGPLTLAGLGPGPQPQPAYRDSRPPRPHPHPHHDLRSPGRRGVTHVFSFPAEHRHLLQQQLEQRSWPSKTLLHTYLPTHPYRSSAARTRCRRAAERRALPGCRRGLSGLGEDSGLGSTTQA